MKAFIVARALRRAAMASVVVPSLVDCGGASSPFASSGNLSGASSTDASGSGEPSGASGTAASGTSSSGTVSASGSTSGATTGSEASGYSSGSSGATSGASSGSSSGSPGDGGSGCSIKDSVSKGQCGIVPYDLAGPASACVPDDGGALPGAECMALCPTQIVPFNNNTTVRLTANDCAIAYNPGAQLACDYWCPAGRRPEGLLRQTYEGGDAAAAFLAQMAHLESASVGAFERLARELEAHGAPSQLVEASRRASRDEVRHARTMKRLAEQAGGQVREEGPAPDTVRSLEEVAVENAVEGCVRETFGAAVAQVQARDAGDADVRRAMRRIATDEARHAELSWAVAAWIDGRLDAAGRRRVRLARERAVEQLRREVVELTDAILTERLGVPSAARATVMLDALSTSLWSRMAA